ncbi:MAG: hypothetical protein NT178_11630 [Proteobacteria bacterium]|nr:hypothetical protein [Pseudomonadota bacterium]
MKRKLILLVLILMVFGLLAVTFGAEPHISGVNSRGATDYKEALSATKVCLKVQEEVYHD